MGCAWLATRVEQLDSSQVVGFQDLSELTDLHKELEKGEEAAKFTAELKKSKVGLINLQAYMNQVDCIEFATAIKNQVGCRSF